MRIEGFKVIKNDLGQCARRALFVARLSILVVALGFVFGSVASTVIAQQTYHNEKYGFSIQPPSGWTVDESGLMGTAVIFIGPTKEDFTVNINILVEDAQGMTLDEYISASKPQLSQILTNYQLVSEGSKVIGGLDTYALVYTHTMGVFDLEVKQVALLEDDKAYVITFTALQSNYDEYLPAFEASVETFKIEPKMNQLLVVGIIVVVVIIIGVVAVLYIRRR